MKKVKVSQAHSTAYCITDAEEKFRKSMRTTREMREDIVVTVYGLPGTGKSAVANCIRVMLGVAGLNVTMTDDNGDDTGISDEPACTMAYTWKKRLRTVVERGRYVHVRTCQMNRTRHKKEMRTCKSST